jgi:2-polyprenyl-3-methyl-5-hydroxy-6-metoxy-1,4-benzoquinol methylase
VTHDEKSSATTITQQREAAFHDAWASGTNLDNILVRESFEAPTALENQFILSQMRKEVGSLAGKKLLDLGAGLGESSVYFALQGAQVTTVDLSPQMVETALALGRKFGVQLQGLVSGAEDLQLPANTYDLIYIANTIHHVHDRPALFAKVHAALKPGGMFFSYDPVAYNPLINIYRRMATAVRTPDEAPLTTADVRLARKYFPGAQHREFWLSTLLLFVKYYLIDRVHPNQDRYWKRILRETPSTLWWWLPLRTLDRLLTRIPLIRWLAWNIAIWGRKPNSATEAR